MSCLLGARFNMRATILRQVGADVDGSQGHWETITDPISGAIERVWIVDSDNNPGNGVQKIVVNCMARGITNGGIRVAGTTQRYSNLYENIDWVVMTIPKSVIITKRDRVTEISNSTGEIIWTEEELEGNPATIFLAMGSTPVIDPFGNHIENTCLLQRAEVQKP